QPVLLIGAGNLGSALLGYLGLPSHNFNIVAVFDNNPNKIGYKLWDREIIDIARLKEANESLRARMAIISVPAGNAQGVADRLVEAGVKVILNFAPTILKVPEGIVMRDVCFIQELSVLSFFLDSEPK
ncbi:MAG TPA: redox-sensing transcriptional repressor Rex, partial [Armatimonadota bacterium]